MIRMNGCYNSHFVGKSCGDSCCGNECKKAVAMEVGGAYTLEQCRSLTDTYERTGAPFMFLENCCFGRREMMTLNMVQHGFFGEIVHCEGCYAHDLREEISHGKENRHYRLRNYLTRNCENYPTHDLGRFQRCLISIKETGCCR